MKPKGWSRFLTAMLLATLIGYPVFAQQSDETSINQVVQNMQDGWNKKSGAQFSLSFAEEHDYVPVNGAFLPKVTREVNAKAHQELFDGVYKELDLQLRVSKIRFLTPEIAVVHIQGHSHPKGKVEEKRQHITITTVMQKRSGKWEIVAFQNTPVQQREERKERR